MRRFINIVENASNMLPATPENIAKAKAFLLTKWRERASERGEPEPGDVSGGCKFAALFAKAIFGGKIVANEFHTWVDLNGAILDLNEDAADARQMMAGVIPEYMRDYAEQWHLTLPENVYEPDPKFMRSPDFKDRMEGNAPRVKRWVEEFRGMV